MYIEPHHADVLDVIALKRTGGDEHLRARDLFLAVWVSDLFMRRVEANAQWSLFDPSTCPGLNEAWGDEYAALYERYELEGLAVRTMPAQDLWFEILRSQIETGVPYILYKDACNAKSNQQNLGTLKTSNLCRCGGFGAGPCRAVPGRAPAGSRRSPTTMCRSEILEYTSVHEVAVSWAQPPRERRCTRLVRRLTGFRPNAGLQPR